MNILKDPMSALTHFIGVILSIVALILLIMKSIHFNSITLFSFTIFGCSLLLLYSASTIYHSVKKPKWFSELLHKIDHMMIFVLIAGTYTPICLIALNGSLGRVLFSIIWTCAIVGIIFKLFFMNVSRWFYTSIYVLMGWVIILVIFPLVRAVPFQAIIFLILGGLFYTLGAIIYATKWPKINPEIFGFHELFHIFVLIGSISHFWMIYGYIYQ